MDTIFFPYSLIFSFLSTALAIQVLKPLAPHISLIDKRNHRKLHDGDIPLIGGIAMFIGILLGGGFILPSTNLSIVWLLTSAGIVLLGIWDDRKDISVRSRLVIQVILSTLLSLGTGYLLINLGDLFGFGAINIGLLGYLLTPIAIIGAINAFNMMDGIDGLAGTMALVSFTALAVLFSLNGNSYGTKVSFLLIAVILPYLANNLLLPPFKQKVFMGDTGAMLIGFTIVWLLIFGSQTTLTKDISFRPVVAIWIIAIPLMDMVAIMIRRIYKRQSPFTPDRNHLHHIFMRAGLSSRATLLLITSLSAIIATCGILGEIYQIPEKIMLVSFLLLFLSYNYMIKHAWKFSILLKNNT